jgi:hypothetical protein
MAEAVKLQGEGKLRHETAKHRGQKGLLAVTTYGKA